MKLGSVGYLLVLPEKANGEWLEGRWNLQSHTDSFKSFKWKAACRVFCLALESGYGVISKYAGWDTCAVGASRAGEPLHGICLVKRSS